MPLITNLQNPLTTVRILPPPPQQNPDTERQPGQSPPPERQSSQQAGSQSSGGTSNKDTRGANEDTLAKLPSNPRAPMDPTADAKTRKPGNPLDGL
ncbi:hypothetical protein DRE_03443 [Drechslerella stenobrocha 248]|uniref:Uncharacterized protein n=1 Tax=Drechslerella stenobrocha 248 TaxID=1043628 RepID=W7HUC4_9PEZI|nr:hypothetical protein DRE_03443 [Drechslerella stenobrocha 248]